jgi:peptidoglycan/LPS O-acetylase OafA/YrhL
MHFKQIDSLRAIAVTMVFLYHWLPSVVLFQDWHLGSLGVSVFFVLSGFLITKILLTEKEKIDNNKQTLASAFKLFYARRTLRIFPIYYLLLLFLFALNFQEVRSEILWHATYSSNILYFLNGTFSNGLSHLWSLCVEEQFYLVWPILLFLVPFKHLKTFFFFTILLGLVSQVLLSNYSLLGGVLMISKVDAFGWGGLLAYFYSYEKLTWQKIANLYWLQAVVAIGFIVSFFIAEASFGICVFHCLCFFIVNQFVVGFTGWPKRLLENAALIYIGKISYGIYLYHNLMQWLLPFFLKFVGLQLPANEYLNFLIYLIITLIVSSLSWYIIETPVNKLKSRFSYS